MRTRLFPLALAAVAVFSLSAAFAGAQDAPAAQTPTEICAEHVPAQEPANRVFSEAEQVTMPGVDYAAVFCTGVGAIYIDLLEDYAPVTVNNFVFLAEQGYYNNTTFHRVIADFMAQGGDPTGTGRGGPGYTFDDEVLPYLTFSGPGLLAMANAGPGTNGSQFFITTAATTHLNYRHTIFGRVLAGQETVTSIRLRDPESDPEPGTALQTVVIVRDPDRVAIETALDEPSTTEAEAFQAAFELLRPELPPGLAIDEETSRIYTTEETAASAPEAEREAFADFLAAHAHVYRVANTIEATTCALDEIPFMAIGYTVDAFASAEDARTALADGYLETLALAQGYSAAASAELGTPYYTRSGTACDRDATFALTYFKRGRYLIAAQIVLPVDQPIGADRWLKLFVGLQIYESLLSDLFAAEL